MLRNYVSVDVLALLNHVLAREVRGRVGARVRVSPNPNPNPNQVARALRLRLG